MKITQIRFNIFINDSEFTLISGRTFILSFSDLVCLLLSDLKIGTLVIELLVYCLCVVLGIDNEDIQYMKISYEAMLADDALGYWLNDTHWVDHCSTDLYSNPRKKKKDDVRVHDSGCARAEGYYKISQQEKIKYKYHHAKSHAVSLSPNAVTVSKMQGEFSIVARTFRI